MKYTTKSGLELPPEVVEVIEQMKKQYGTKNCPALGLKWSLIPTNIDKALTEIWNDDNFTEFYKLYPKKEVKKDLDSYGNEIVKGEMVEVRDRDSEDWRKVEFLCMADKIKGKYITYDSDIIIVIRWKFCRKITEKQSLKSELQSQMNDLLKQAKEIEAKINEL